MPAKEIKELRQAGKLEEAYAMAKAELEADLSNIWSKRNLSWVLYAQLDEVASNLDAFIAKINEVKDLDLPASEEMFFDNISIVIAKAARVISHETTQDSTKIYLLFDAVKDLPIKRDSKWFSVLFSAMHKGMKESNRYVEFADWWDLENLRSEDFLKEEYNSKKIMSIAEQAYITYAKKLLEGTPLDPFGQQKVIDKDKIQSFLPKLDYLIEKQPDYQYPPYFKAKLLLALGNDGNVLSAFLPFAKQKRNDFWVWELMAEIFLENKEIQFACYCKALSLKTPEDFLIKLRQSFAEMLIQKSMFNEAKTEIQKVISTREKHQWKIPNQIMQWTEMEWYKSANSKRDNSDLYLSQLKQAEEILFQDIPEELIVVEFVNENKNILSFVKDKQKHGFFNYTGKLIKPQIGDLLKVRFNGAGQNGFYKVLSSEKAGPNLTADAKKSFEGEIKINEEGKFGFVDDVFVEPSIVSRLNLQNSQSVSGNAILSFNKKKNQWGWKMIEINSEKKNNG
ncbi:MAG: hypothetical protein FJZ66_02330 [Bacteroidetes bacterium]|nr:hypothetical protein [Bacteroidota bacterium]